MSPAPLRIERYAWPGGEEHAIRFGPPDGPTVLWSPALLEEANRTRALVADVARRLVARGIGSVVPDLPGQGESLFPPERARLADWHAALAAAAATFRPALVAAVRAGALIEAPVPARWHLSPLTGEQLRRELHRVGPSEADGVVEVAGNRLSPYLLADLAAARPAEGRTVRLASDPRPADLSLDGPPLWRRSEPATDPALAAALADDLAACVRRCAA